MSRTFVENSRPWFLQAMSDHRTATALLAVPGPMRPQDACCHVASLCAQSIEKCIKGFVFLNGGHPSLDHRPDKYLTTLLTVNGKLLRHPEHYEFLCNLFDPHTKGIVRTLLDLTPGGGGRRNDVPNTEYPWVDSTTGKWSYAPVSAPEFAGSSLSSDWVRAAGRVCAGLHRIFIGLDRGTEI